MNWQPIATAPRDGTIVLLFGTTIDHGDDGDWFGAGPNAFAFGKWFERVDEQWVTVEQTDNRRVTERRHLLRGYWKTRSYDNDHRFHFSPTHWAPVPAPPDGLRAEIDDDPH